MAYIEKTVRQINDHFSLNDVIPISKAEEQVCRDHRIPFFKGKLFEVDEFGNHIFKRSNTVVLGGSINALEKLTGQFATYRPQSINMMSGSNMVLPLPAECEDYTEEYERTIEDKSHIIMFGVGTGGAADSFNQVYAPDFKQNQIANWVPFRISSKPTLNVAGLLYGSENKEERKKYHFIVKDSSDPVYPYQWYLKEFETAAEVKSLWKNAPDLTKDGTEIISSSDLTSGPDGVGIECLAEFMIHISADDIYPYFQSKGMADMARFNTLGLYSASLINPDYESSQISDDYMSLSADDYKEAYNTRLFSVVNIDNVSLKMRNELTYAYRIYASL